MMGVQEKQKDLFNYGVDLDKRVRLDNPLRRILEAVDFGFGTGGGTGGQTLNIQFGRRQGLQESSQVSALKGRANEAMQIEYLESDPHFPPF